MASTGEVWKLGHRPALDGVRGIAILLVLVCHTAVPGLPGGGAVGVTVFFTLSGFLITGLLLAEHDRAGHIDLRAFYVRRVRRLLPALLVAVTLTAAAGSLLGAWFFRWSDVAPVLLYVGNWIEADPARDMAGLGGTWSLAVEEQFYLLWPLLLVAVAPRGRGTVLAIALLGVGASLAVRLHLFAAGVPSDRIYYGSDTVAVGLLAGAALIVWLGGRQATRSRPLVAVVALVALLAVSTWDALTAAFHAAPVAALATVVLLWAATGVGGCRWLEVGWLRWFGHRSYGLYLIHGPLAWALRDHYGWSWPALVLVVFPLSCGAAELLWRLVEQPALGRRHLHDRGSDSSTGVDLGLHPASPVPHPVRPLIGVRAARG